MYTDVLNDTPFKGKGQIVTVTDSGFDIGSTTDTHPAFTGRVKDLKPIGRFSTKKTDNLLGYSTVSDQICAMVLSPLVFLFLNFILCLAYLWLGRGKRLFGYNGRHYPGHRAPGRPYSAIATRR